MSKPQAMMSLQFSRASLRASGMVRSLQHWHEMRVPTTCQGLDCSLEALSSEEPAARSMSAWHERLA